MDELKKNELINIEEIKSSYIIKEVLSFLSKKQKLNVIIYNKKLQKIFGVCIEDYKKISGRYKKGERNGIGKEYDINTNKLIFEGEYINGKRNGKGKEYSYYNIKFEGEYLNGKRWNGKGYNNSGDLEYELNNGSGKVKEYYYTGNLKFEGEYLNGEMNGSVKEYHKNGKLKFEGEYYMEKVKNLIYIMVNQNLKVNIDMGKNMEKEKNIINMVILNLKENIFMEKDGMEK